MAFKYLCTNWQSLLEMVVNLCGNGYHYINVTYFPDNKQEQWHTIDDKIIQKYKLKGMTKDKRYQRKKKGLANFHYLRWNNIALVFHTEGEIIVPDKLFEELTKGKKKGKLGKQIKSSGSMKSKFNQRQIDLYSVFCDDNFTDINKQSIAFKIDEILELDLIKKVKEKGAKETVTFKLSKQLFKEKKVELLEHIESRARNLVLYSFSMLNGLPPYHGILEQKKELQQFILYNGRKHGMKFKREELFIRTYFNKQQKVFKQDTT